jgi:hypothetical protein
MNNKMIILAYVKILFHKKKRFYDIIEKEKFSANDFYLKLRNKSFKAIMN